MYKKLVFSILILFFTIKTQAQNSTISIANLQILYIGVDNPLKVIAEGIPSKELEISADNGVSILGEKGSYIARATKTGKTSILVLHRGKIIEKHDFYCRRIPNAIVILAVEDRYAKGGDIPIGIMKAASKLGIDYDYNLYINNMCSIQSFAVDIVSKNRDYQSFMNYGENFNPQIINALQKIKAGDQVHFDEIKGKCPGDEVGRIIGSLWFSIY